MMAEDASEIKEQEPGMVEVVDRGGFRQTPTIDRLIEALIKAQGQIQNADKNQTNPHFGSRYADLASVWDSIRGPLTANGLCIIQGATTAWEGLSAIVTVTTRLMHSSAQWVENDIRADARGGSPQEVGSTITYLKRYAINAMVGCASESDDDGEATRGPEVRREPEARKDKKQEPRKLAKKDVDAIVAAFGKYDIPIIKLEEKLERGSGHWTEHDRMKLLKLHKDIEGGAAPDDVFGAEIPEPKEEAEPGAKG